jgi:putative acetyltransferase
MPPEIQIGLVPVEAVLESGLIAALDADLAGRYPGEPINGIDVDHFRAVGGCFALARAGVQAVACGAFRPVDAATVEIKRMYVRPEFRGQRLGRALLAVLEEEARRRGFTTSILETGERNYEAIVLYKACGYAHIPPFGPFINSLRSVCFSKTL